MNEPDCFAEAVPRWCWLAARVLGWRPGEFWSATPTELAAALHDPQGAQTLTGPTRDQINSMMEREAHGR